MAVVLGCGDRADAGPGLAVVGAAFDPDRPGLVAFYRRAADDDSVCQDEWLGADGSVEASGQVFDRGPCFTVVHAEAAPSRPARWVRAELVIEPEFAVGAVKEDWVITSYLGFAGEFDGRGPSAVVRAAGGPNGDVGFAFAGATKPGREKFVVMEFDNGGGVSGGKRGIGVNEFLSEWTWRRRCR